MAGTILSLLPNEIDAYDPDFNDSVTLQLLDTQYSDLFTLKGRSLAVDRRIDREANVPNIINLQVVTTDQYGLQGPVLKITVTVNDINDHAPVFEQDVYRGQITGKNNELLFIETHAY